MAINPLSNTTERRILKVCNGAWAAVQIVVHVANRVVKGLVGRVQAYRARRRAQQIREAL